MVFAKISIRKLTLWLVLLPSYAALALGEQVFAAGGAYAIALRGQVYDDCGGPVRCAVRDRHKRRLQSFLRRDAAPDHKAGAVQSTPRAPAAQTASRADAPDDKALRGTTIVETAFAIGYTDNAGPTLDARSSSAVSTTLAFAHSRTITGTVLELSGDVTNLEFPEASETRNLSGRLSAEIKPDTGKGRDLSISASLLKTADVDEEVLISSLGLDQRWQYGSLAPFLTTTAAYLDYADIQSLFLEFGNQDDRDRLSLTQQAGVRYSIAKDVTLTAGAGADAKIYTDKFDDFGLRHDSTSAFALLGIAYSTAVFSAEVLYAPVWRTYREALFDSVFAHTLSSRANLTVSKTLSVYGGARLGLEESDFLITQVVDELAITLGARMEMADQSLAGIEVVYTTRDHIGFDRSDEKIEVALKGRTPIAKGLFLTGEARYLDFSTSFLNLKTEQTLGLIGVAYRFGE